MNESKLLRQISEKIKSSEGASILNLYTVQNVSSDFNKNVKLRNIVFKNKENANSKITSSSKNKIQNKKVQFNCENPNSKSVFSYNLSNLMDNEIIIPKRNYLSNNVNKQPKKNKATFNNNNFSTIPNNLDAPYFIIDELTTIVNQPSLPEKIILKTLLELEKLKAVNFHSAYSSNNSKNILFVDFTALDNFELKFHNNLNKFKESTITKIPIDNIKLSSQKCKLSLIRTDEYQNEKYYVSYHLFKKLGKFEEKVLKFNKYYKSSKTGNKNVDLAYPVFFIPKEFEKSVIAFSTAYGDFHFQRKFDKMMKLTEKASICFKENEKLNFIFDETSTQVIVNEIYLYKIPIPTVVKQKEKIKLYSLNRSKFEMFKSEMNFVQMDEIANTKIDKLKKKEKEEKIINNDNNIVEASNIISPISQANKKRKYNEFSNSSNTNPNSQTLILVNMLNIKRILQPKHLKDLITSINNTQINKNQFSIQMIEDKQMLKMFSNIDIILSMNKGVILIDPEEFEDEYDLNSFERLSETINKNYICYEIITIAIYENKNKSDYINRLIETLRKYLNKKFGTIFQNFNFELNFLIVFDSKEIINNIILNNSEAHLNRIIKNYNCCNKDYLSIQRISQRFNYFNLYEFYMFINVKTEDEFENLITILMKKYRKKNMTIDKNLIRNSINF